MEKKIKRKYRGKRAMYLPFIAMYPVCGCINKDALMCPKGLAEVIRDYGSYKFEDFVIKTLCSLMDDFGVIEDEHSVKLLLLEESGIPSNTYKKYMDILKKNLVFREINNKKIVINPYQLYKNPTISCYKLWQLQANWELNKVMTYWFEVTDKYKPDLV